MSKNSHKQLPNLDSVRALAALIVVISHIELQKQEGGFSNVRPIMRNFGSIGVTIFFVLSGFLITYLLLQEHSSKGAVNIKSFYFRRILRIWPLYFVVLLFGIFIFPANIENVSIFLSVFFLPNIAFMLGKLPALIDPIWSLGVEEQFYLFHPHIFRQASMKKIFNTLIGFFVFFYVLKFSAAFFHWDIVSKIMYKARFDCMMLGGIFSVWVVNHQNDEKYFKSLFSPRHLLQKGFQRVLFVFYVSYLVLAVINPGFYNDQFLSILTACALINLAFNPECVVNLENKFLSFVGKISFGLYLLHKFPVDLTLRAVRALEINNLLAQNLIIYSVSISLAFLLAYLSFHYFESHFLRMKNKKFSVPVSTQMVVQPS